MRPRPAGRHDGAATVETVLAVPVLLVVMSLLAQTAVWWHADQIAAAAAQQALGAAQAHGAPARAGHQAAEQLLIGAGGLRAPAVQIDVDATTVTVIVTGLAPRLLPGPTLAVSGRAAGPRERYLTPDQR